MTLKIAMLALALFAAWLVLFRPRRGTPGPARRPPSSTTELERCARCGVYRLPGGRCDCDSASAEGA